MPGVWSFTLVYQIDVKHIAGGGKAVFAHTPLLDQQPHRESGSSCVIDSFRVCDPGNRLTWVLLPRQPHISGLST